MEGQDLNLHALSGTWATTMRVYHFTTDHIKQGSQFILRRVVGIEPTHQSVADFSFTYCVYFAVQLPYKVPAQGIEPWLPV